jgi:hypothetical protein
MKSQSDISSDQQPATLLGNLIGVLIMIMDLIFFVSAPVAGIFLVFLVFLIPLVFASIGAYQPAEGYIIVPFLCPPPLGILLGFYTLKKVNQKMTLGREQRNLALAIKMGVGIVASVCITCFILAIRSSYEKLNVMLVISVISLILSAFVGWYVYIYLNRKNT